MIGAIVKGLGLGSALRSGLQSFVGAKAGLEAARGTRQQERALNRQDAKWELDTGHAEWDKRRQKESRYAIQDMASAAGEHMRQRDAYAARYRQHDIADLKASQTAQADIEKRYFADSLDIETNAAEARMKRLYPGATPQELLGAGGYGPSGGSSGTSVGNGSQRAAAEVQNAQYQAANMESNTQIALEQMRGQTARDVAQIQTRGLETQTEDRVNQTRIAGHKARIDEARMEIEAWKVQNQVKLDWEKWAVVGPTQSESFILHKLMLSMGVENMIVSAIITQLKAAGIDLLDPRGVIDYNKLIEALQDPRTREWIGQQIGGAVVGAVPGLRSGIDAVEALGESGLFEPRDPVRDQYQNERRTNVQNTGR